MFDTSLNKHEKNSNINKIQRVGKKIPIKLETQRTHPRLNRWMHLLSTSSPGPTRPDPYPALNCHHRVHFPGYLMSYPLPRRKRKWPEERLIATKTTSPLSSPSLLISLYFFPGSFFVKSPLFHRLYRLLPVVRAHTIESKVLCTLMDTLHPSYICSFWPDWTRFLTPFLIFLFWVFFLVFSRLIGERAFHNLIEG